MSEAAASHKRRLNVSRQREHLWIAKLKRLPDGKFEIEVKKLLGGFGPSAVAKWLVESRLDSPEFKELQFPTYKKYLCALNQRLKHEMRGVKRADLSELASRAVRAEFERQKAAVVNGEAATVQPARKIWNVVTKTVQQLDAELALNYIFAIQVARVETMRAMEIKTPMLVITGDGNKEILVLNDIAAQLVKLELKRPRARGKSGRFVPEKRKCGSYGH
jgi:hypothetical protein